jgi:hypothetical protein
MSSPVCATTVATISCVAAVLPVECIPELVAEYAIDGCVADSCGPFVDQAYHAASSDLQCLIDTPYHETVHYLKHADTPVPMLRKTVTSRLAHLIVAMVGDRLHGGECLTRDTVGTTDCMSLELVDLIGHRDVGLFSMREALLSEFKRVASSRRPRGTRYLGRIRDLQGRHGYVLPRDREGLADRVFLAWLAHQTSPHRRVDIDMERGEVFFSAETEKRLRELAPNLFS